MNNELNELREHLRLCGHYVSEIGRPVPCTAIAELAAEVYAEEQIARQIEDILKCAAPR